MGDGKGKYGNLDGKGKYGNDLKGNSNAKGKHSIDFKGSFDGKGKHGKDFNGKGKNASYDDAGSAEGSKGKSKTTFNNYGASSGKGASGKSSSTWLDGDNSGRPTPDGDTEVGKGYTRNKI